MDTNRLLVAFIASTTVSILLLSLNRALDTNRWLVAFIRLLLLIGALMTEPKRKCS